MSASGHLGRFYLLALRNSAAVNMGGQTPAWVSALNSQGYIPNVLWIYTPKEYWIIQQLYFYFLEEPPQYFPQWLCHLTILNNFLNKGSCTFILYQSPWIMYPGPPGCSHLPPDLSHHIFCLDYCSSLPTGISLLSYNLNTRSGSLKRFCCSSPYSVSGLHMSGLPSPPPLTSYPLSPSVTPLQPCWDLLMLLELPILTAPSA